MTKVVTVLLIVCATLITLSACNLPNSGGDKETAAPALKVSVSVATEYRSGPGQVYDVIGVLNPGREVEAVSRSPDGDYLVIQDPANPTSLVWLKSEYATASGNPAALPISLPPPTPTLVKEPESKGGGFTPVVTPPSVGGCPTPVGGGPTPVSCPTSGEAPSPAGSGCPTPVGGGPTPVSCPSSGEAPPPAGGGCPTPVGGGPTPVSCPLPGEAPPPAGGCPTPVGGGPTPVSCSSSGEAPPSTGGGCPTPVGGGPTPVSCPSSGK